VADSEAGAGAGAGEPDEMLGGNVRHKQRGADGKPSDVAASEKIIGGAAFFAGEIKTDGKDDQEIQPNDDEVNGSESAVGDGGKMIHSLSGFSVVCGTAARPIIMPRSLWRKRKPFAIRGSKVWQ
jgi:hypothetical protein